MDNEEPVIVQESYTIEEAEIINSPSNISDLSITQVEYQKIEEKVLPNLPKSYITKTAISSKKIKPRISISTSSIRKKFEKVNKYFDKKKLTVEEIITKTKIVLPVPPFPSFLTLLPKAIAIKILLYLPFQEIANLGLVCSSWYGLATDGMLWSELCRLKNWSAESSFSHIIDWKKIFAFNYLLQKNWASGNAKTEALCIWEKTPKNSVESLSDGIVDTIKSAISEDFQVNGPLTPHFGPVHAVCIDDGCMVTGSKDGAINVWALEFEESENLAKFEIRFSVPTPLTDLTEIPLTVFSLQLTEKRIIAGFANGGIGFYNRFSGEVQVMLEKEHEDGVCGIHVWSRKESYFVSCSFDGTCRIYHFESVLDVSDLSQDVYESTGAVLRIRLKGVVKTGNIGLYCIDGYYDQCKPCFVVGGTEGNVELFDVDVKQIGTLKGHSDSVTSVSCVFDEYCASGSMDKTVRLWSIKSQSCLKIYTDHSNWIKQVYFHKLDENTSVLVVSSFDQTLTISKFERNEELKQIKLYDLVDFRACLNNFKVKDEYIVSKIVSDKAHLVVGMLNGSLLVLNFVHGL